MKFYFLSLLLFLGSYHALAAPQVQERPIIIQNVNIREWPESLSEDAAYKIMTEIMNGDPEAKILLEKANQKLKSGGIQSLRNIFSYCSKPRTSSDLRGYFYQNTKILETRISIPGLAKKPWSESTLTEQRTGFSTKILTTPFLEYFAISMTPMICIYKDKALFQSYNAFVHELTHFLLDDPFDNVEELLSSRHHANHVENAVNHAGGEMDAFKAGNAAEKRFFKKYNITNYRTVSQKYFNDDGELTDEEGLRKYLTEYYADYYESPQAREQLQKSKKSYTQYKLDNLRYAVEYLEFKRREDLIQKVLVEIDAMEKLLSEL